MQEVMLKDVNVMLKRFPETRRNEIVSGFLTVGTCFELVEEEKGKS